MNHSECDGRNKNLSLFVASDKCFTAKGVRNDLVQWSIFVGKTCKRNGGLLIQLFTGTIPLFLIFAKVQRFQLNKNDIVITATPRTNNKIICNHFHNAIAHYFLSISDFDGTLSETK